MSICLWNRRYGFKENGYEVRGMIIGVTMLKIGLGLLFLILALDPIDGPTGYEMNNSVFCIYDCWFVFWCLGIDDWRR